MFDIVLRVYRIGPSRAWKRDSTLARGTASIRLG